MLRNLFFFFRGFTSEDLPPRRAFQQDETRESPLRRSDSTRPSGRSIYMQRKEYSETLSKNPDNINVRVEHLFICEIDGLEVKTVDDCVAKLKNLNAKGRLWPQEMIMEVQGPYLLLNDIETKTELDSVPLSCIVQIKAVLDSCDFNSLLAITVQERSKRNPRCFMFQCEETGADLIKSDLDKAVQRGGSNLDQHREPPDDILNHVLNDLEIFVGKVSTAVNTPGQQGDMGKKKKTKKKSKKNGNSLHQSMFLTNK
uniref:EPS8 signaling adaptor L3b n=1 Tax=Neolamprologus brichardi TaxID=32507 RepID=A0A3Q4GU46_NEOBR